MYNYCPGHLRGGKFANGKFVNFLILPDISHAFFKKQYRTNYNFDSSRSKKNLATMRIYKFTTDLRICHLLRILSFGRIICNRFLPSCVQYWLCPRSSRSAQLRRVLQCSVENIKCRSRVRNSTHLKLNIFPGKNAK